MLDLQNYTVMTPTFQVEELESNGAQATISIEPLEQGYGHTIGNALRRVLLSSLPGAAVTMVHIDGVDHQFTALEGLSEDAVELILNIKQIRIKSIIGETTSTMKLEMTGPAEVTAQDLETSGGFEISNPEQHIATLAKGQKLHVEMTVESGVGYSQAQDRKTSTIGEIPVDAVFSPVITANYKVEATRVGRRTDFDRVVLSILTDGTITPLEAVEQAAQILVRQFSQIVTPIIPQEEVRESQLSPEEAETLRLTVEELDLPTRIANALRKGGFKTVGDLVGVARPTIAKVKNLGEKSVDVINDALKKKGVELGA